jgi:hypothetical protein
MKFHSLSPCDSFAVNLSSLGSDVGSAGLCLAETQLINCGGEAAERLAKPSPVNGAVTQCPRSVGGDSSAVRSRVKAENPGNITRRSARVCSMAKENLNLGYRRNVEVAYYICRQLLARREAVWGCCFRHSFRGGIMSTRGPSPADLRGLRSAITVNRNEVTLGECLPSGKAAVSRKAPMSRIVGEANALGKAGGYADAHTREWRIIRK